MLKTIFDYLIVIISIIASIITIVLFKTQSADSLTLQGEIAITFLGIFSAFFLFYNIYLKSIYRYRTRYVEMFEDLNEGFHNIHLNKIPTSVSRDERDKEILATLNKMCTSVSSAFTKVYGHHISVCLKIIGVENDQPIVQTLCRDNKSGKNRKVGADDDVTHWLIGNSDFTFIDNCINTNVGKNNYFANNFLPVKFDYSNTRFPDTWKTNGSLGVLGFVLRFIQWPLPYKSTLVVPIVPLLLAEHTTGVLRGYLCVDSPHCNVFNTRYDVEILNGIADGLYNKIDILNSKR